MEVQASVFQMRTHIFDCLYTMGNFFEIIDESESKFIRVVFELFNFVF